MSRRIARETVFKLVFEYTFYEEKNDDTLGLMLLNDSFDEDDRNYVEKTYAGVAAHFGELKEVIEKHSDGFAVSRIYRPDLCVMLIGAYEMLYASDVPDFVAINEAVALSKLYGAEKSPKFVNGVLAGILNEKNGGEIK